MQQTQTNNTTGNRAAQPQSGTPLDPLACLLSELLVVLCEHLVVNYISYIETVFTTACIVLYIIIHYNKIKNLNQKMFYSSACTSEMC